MKMILWVVWHASAMGTPRNVPELLVIPFAASIPNSTLVSTDKNLFGLYGHVVNYSGAYILRLPIQPNINGLKLKVHGGEIE